jgi:hypothetical protein
VIFATSLNLGNIINFFRDIDLVPVSNMGISLPAPKDPSAHTALYTAAGLFSLIWGFFQIAFLGLRFAFNSPAGKKAENAGDIVSSFGTYYLVNTYLINMPPSHIEAQKLWFSFWAMVIALIGVMLIVRALVLAVLPRNP